MRGATMMLAANHIAAASTTPDYWEQAVASLPLQSDYVDYQGNVWSHSGQTTFDPTGGPYGDGCFTVVDGYLRTPYTQALTLGAGDFTVRFWAKMSSGNNATLVALVSTGVVLYILYDSNQDRIVVSATGTGTMFRAASFVDNSHNGFHFVELSRRSGVAALFVDGILQDTHVYTDVLGLGRRVELLRRGRQYFTGGFCDFEVIKGLALHTSDYVLPRAHLVDYG